MEQQEAAVETTSALQAALEQKQAECHDLRARLDAALKDVAESKARERTLEERCVQLKHDLERVSADSHLRANHHSHHVAESSAPPSECSDMTEDDIHPVPAAVSAVSSCPEGPASGTSSFAREAGGIMPRSRSTAELEQLKGEARPSVPAHVRQISYSSSMDFAPAGGSSNLASPRTTESDFSDEERHRMKDDSSRRVHEVHRRYGDRNMAGFLRDLGYQVEGGWNPTQAMFDKQKKIGLVMSHPDKQLSKPFREQCLAEAVFKELNEWEYKPPIDRPHFGFGSINPASTSSPPTTTATAGGYSKHSRTPSYGSLHGGHPPSGLAYQHPRSAMEIASRLSRRSADPTRHGRMYSHH